MSRFAPPARPRTISRWLLAVAARVLQSAMVALVLLAIWQPSILIEELRQGDNIVALMLDTSASMNYSEGERSRMQQALVERLADEAELDRIEGRHLAAIDRIESKGLGSRVRSEVEDLETLYEQD
mgnify:CR=1 FL=1